MEGRKFDGNIRVGDEARALRTRRDLILIHQQRMQKTGGIIAQVPAGGIAIRGARERAAAENQQISAAT